MYRFKGPYTLYSYIRGTVITGFVSFRNLSSKKLYPVLRGRLSLKDRALALVFKDRQRPPQQFLVDPLEGGPGNVLAGMKLVEGTNPPNVPGRRGPLVDVRRQLLRLAPQNPTGGLFLVEPFAVSGCHEVVADGGYAFFIELAANVIVLPKRALVDHKGFQFVLRVEAQDEFPP
jgi:hypothetical protein